jgi:hypothetical protein
MWDGSESTERRVHMAGIAIFGCITVSHDKMNEEEKNEKKSSKTV